MSGTLTDKKDQSRWRYTLGGLCLAGIGLTVGAVVISQVVLPLLNGAPVTAAIEWLAAEAALAGCLSGLGFVLMVVGANSLTPPEDFHRES